MNFPTHKGRRWVVLACIAAFSLQACSGEGRQKEAAGKDSPYWYCWDDETKAADPNEPHYRGQYTEPDHRCTPEELKKNPAPPGG